MEYCQGPWDIYSAETGTAKRIKTIIDLTMNNVTWISEHQVLVGAASKPSAGGNRSVYVFDPTAAAPRPRLLLKGYDSAGLSPDHKTLACTSSPPHKPYGNRLSVFDFKTLKKIAEMPSKSKRHWFDGPAVWLLNRRFAVTVQSQSGSGVETRVDSRVFILELKAAR